MTSQVRGLIALLLLALAIRTPALLGWSKDVGLHWHPSLTVDTDAYLRLAANWSISGVFGFEDTDGVVTPTAFRPPLYPWLLSWFESSGSISSAGVAGINLIVGLLTVWLTWSIGNRLEFRWSWLAALAVAVDPILLRASQSAMTETLAATLALAVWRVWLAIPNEHTLAASPTPTALCENRPQSGIAASAIVVGLGMLLGLSVLARPTAAPWALLCTGCLLLHGPACWKRRLRNAVLVSACVLACVAPWTLRNMSHLGKPVWATTHGGYTLLLANNPLIYDHFLKSGPNRDWDAEPFHATWAGRRTSHIPVTDASFWMNNPKNDAKESPQSGNIKAARAQTVLINELDDDRLAYDAAKATIGRQPGSFVLSCFYRIGWFWAFWPNQAGAAIKLAIGMWYAAWFLLATLGLSQLLRRRLARKWLPALLLGVTLTGVHAIYWSNMRMRAPVVPTFYLLAIAAISPLCTRTNDNEPSSNRRMT